MEKLESIGLYYAGFMFLLAALGAIFGAVIGKILFHEYALIWSILFFSATGGVIGIGLGLLKHASLLVNDYGASRKK
jgi:hypothetical protein